MVHILSSKDQDVNSCDEDAKDDVEEEAKKKEIEKKTVGYGKGDKDK